MTFCQQADPDRALDFGISIENFMYCDNIRISRRLSMMSSDIIHVELQDTKRRSLIVNVKVSVKPGGSLRVSDLLQKKNESNLSRNFSQFVGNRKLKQQRRRRLRKRDLKSEFALLQSLSSLFRLVQVHQMQANFSGFVF